MRKITKEAVNAFLNGKVFRKNNTVVQPETDGRTFMYLHGNRIALRHANERIIGTLAGWPTPTTRERLNGIARMVNGCGICQRNFENVLDNGDRVADNEWFTILD